MIDAKVRTGDRERLNVEKGKRKKGESGSGRWKARVLGRIAILLLCWPCLAHTSAAHFQDAWRSLPTEGNPQEERAAVFPDM